MTKQKFDNRERLSRVKEKQWREALDELTAYITWCLHGRTEYGAHCAAVLGDNALAHYSHEAYTRLINGEWKWDENLSLAEQLKVIAGSLICNQVTKWKRNPEAPPGIVDPERVADELEDDRDEELDVTYEMAAEAIKGDKELERYLMAIRDCNDFDDLCEYLGIPRKKAYRLQEKLMRKLDKYLKK